MDRVSRPRVAVVGSGPAALMAADVLSAGGIGVDLYEKRKTIGRKLLVAGSSGLNISNSLPLAEFARHYSGPAGLWRRVLGDLDARKWIAFIEAMGFKTFEGTSGRYFLEEMKAAKFVQAWQTRLREHGVEFKFGHELTGFAPAAPNGVRLEFADRAVAEYPAALLALGGASWEPNETPLRWPSAFARAGIEMREFKSANVGFHVAWPAAFLKEAEGKPLKNIVLRTARATREGELVVTAYGLEGTPIYFAGTPGRAWLDLKAGLTEAQVLAKLLAVRENLSPIRRVGKQLALGEAAQAMIFHLTPKLELADGSREGLARLARRIKSFELELGDPRPLPEAISSSGGVLLTEIDDDFMVRRMPGLYLAGEMLNWDVPTGGFLIQGCVAQGYAAARAIERAYRRAFNLAQNSASAESN